jgi:hypothetical protein
LEHPASVLPNVVFEEAQIFAKVIMEHIGWRNPPPEPDPELVLSALVKVLEMAGRQGITQAEFIQMLESGMRISDFLRAMDGCTEAGCDIDLRTVN